MKNCGIYMIVSPSNKIYIGQSKDVDQRFHKYKTYQCKRQPALYYSLKKHGSENHTFNLIHQLPKDVTREVMDSYEQFVIAQLKEAGAYLLNLNEGGKTNKELSEETRRKLAESKRGKKYWLGRKHTEETKEKIRLGNTGKVFTEERLKNMSIGNTGKQSPRKGAVLSDETKQKIRLGHLGKTLSEEHKMKIKAGLKKRFQS